MRHNFEHYVSKFLGYVWYATLVIGSLTIFVIVVKALLTVIGVI